MHSRYPAPYASTSFHEQTKLKHWLSITKAYAYDSINKNGDQPDHIKAALQREFLRLDPPLPEVIAEREKHTGHDVVAFLECLEMDLSPAAQRHLHYGLTSSDLVETAHHLMLRQHAHFMAINMHDLWRAMDRWEMQHTERAGRTHGQIADVTSWNWQLHVQQQNLRRIHRDLEREMQQHLVKSPGPTGQSPLRAGDGSTLARQMDGYVVPSTQIIPRDYQLRWASVYLRLAGALENLALQVRLAARSEVAEVREGALRIGSSSMPHKVNPIDSEKVCGLARVARGYFTTIAENVAFWEDRDISNSSVERIVIPDFAAVVEYMLFTMTVVMQNLEVDFGRMKASAEDPRTMSNLMQALLQKHFEVGPVRASRIIRERIDFAPDFFVEEAAMIDDEGMSADLNVDTPKIQAWWRDVYDAWEQMLGNKEAPEGREATSGAPQSPPARQD